MALAKQPTKISLSSSQIPMGATDPGGTNLSSSQPTYRNLKISVLKATVEDASEATTFDNILTNVTVGIEKQVADRLTADDLGTTATVNYNIDWKALRTNLIQTEDLLKNVAPSYVCTVDVYINVV